MTSSDVSLSTRLDDLRQQRESTLLEIRPQGVGDDADRATNVDAHVRLAMLDKRIADVEYALTQSASHSGDSAVVGPGRSVTLDFGDGPENYTVGPAELATPDHDVVTPDSALGRVILGVGKGFSTTYQPRPGHTQQVTVLDVA